MARIMDGEESDGPPLQQLIRPRIALKPTSGNGPSPSPKKSTRTAKDYYDSQEEDHSGKESPFKSPSRKLKIKQPASGRPQRSLKLDKVDQLLPPKLKDVTLAPQLSPQKISPVRESPRRRAKPKVNYAAMVLDDGSDGLEGGSDVEEDDGDWKGKAHLSSEDEDDDVFGGKATRLVSRSKAPSKTASPKKAASRSPVKSARNRALTPDIFDDSDEPGRSKASVGNYKTKIARSSSVSSGEEVEDRTASLRAGPPTTQTPFELLERPATPTRLGAPPVDFSPSKSRMLSPSKRANKIPTPPATYGRPSLDAFWDQDQVNNWTDIHSPKKELKFLPRKFQFESTGLSSDSEEADYVPRNSPKKSVVPGSPSKKQTTASEKKAFASNKEQLAQDFFQQLDERITDGEIKRLAESGGGVTLTWSKKLNSTAGRANWRREAIKRLDATTNVMTTTGYRHVASIELAEKVIENEERLYNVLAHEYCHLANFMVSRVINNPHGASFKDWARKTTTAFAKSHGVEVTTKHDYDISYKYIWVCMDEDSDAACGTEYQRHSKSIDPTRHTCGKCRGRLVQVKPKPRAKAGSGPATTATKSGSEYTTFVKEQFQAVRSGLPPGSPMKDVMKEIGVRYRAKKEHSQTSPEKMVEVVEISDDIPSEGSDSSDQTVIPESADSELADVAGIARKLDFLNLGGDNAEA